MIPRFQIFTIILLLFLTGAVIGLFIFLIRIEKESRVQKNTQNQVTVSQAQPAFDDDNMATLTDIQTSMSAIMTRLESLEEQSAQKSAINTIASSEKIPVTLRKETLYLGSATTSNREWVETGLELVINANDYPANTTAVYEAGLSIAGGEAWSRIKNKTTGAIINISEVSHSGSTLTWKSSSTFKLHPGENRYTVELRSTSGEVVNLSGARLILSW